MVRWEDGHGELYTLFGGLYQGSPGVTDQLVRDQNSGYFTLTRKDGTTYLFQWDGKLLQIVDRTQGKVVAFGYDQGWNLVSIVSRPPEII